MSRDILMSKIEPDAHQPRKYFDTAKLDELARSMQQNGLASPILLRPAGDKLVIVHGERRFRAAQRLGWETIPAEIREMSQQEARVLALVENVQRADLSPVEEARAYQTFLAQGMTQAELGEQIGKSQSYIATKLRWLKMPEFLQLMLDRKKLSEGHVKQLLRLRKFYRDVLAEAPQQPDEEMLAARENADCYVMGVLLGARPLDTWGAAWPKNDADLFDALVTFTRASHTAREDNQIPAWWYAALWFAFFVSTTGTSVAELNQLLDKFEAHVATAVVWLGLTNKDKDTPGKPKNVQEELFARQYYGYKADLRHAGLSSWADTEDTGLLVDMLKIVASHPPNSGQWDSCLLPTSLQAEVEKEPEGRIARYLRFHNARTMEDRVQSEMHERTHA